MLYKLLPVVATVAAERFLAAPTAFPGGQGEGYTQADATNTIVKSTAHGYSDADVLIYLANGGTVQAGFTDATAYTVANKTDNGFDVGTVTTGEAQTQEVTWQKRISAAKSAANDAACGTFVDATDSVFDTEADHGYEAGNLVMYSCKMDGTDEKCLAGMTNHSIWTIVAADPADTKKFRLAAASGTGNLQLAGTQDNKTNVVASSHSWTNVGAAWKSITTAAPSAASSNFNVMVGTVASGFLYLLM